MSLHEAYGPPMPKAGCFIATLMTGAMLVAAFLLSGCTHQPTALLADGTKVTLGGSFLTKKQNHTAKATLPNGTVLETSTAESDETLAAKALISAGTVRAGLNSLNNAVDAAPAIIR